MFNHFYIMELKKVSVQASIRYWSKLARKTSNRKSISTLLFSVQMFDNYSSNEKTDTRAAAKI